MAKHPDWTDEELFQGARRFVIATLQVLFNTSHLFIVILFV